MAEQLIRIEQLTVTDRSGVTIIDRLTEPFEKNRLTCIVGPSGAGKTTLLRCINRLIDLTPELTVSGRISFDGEDIRARGVDVDDLRRRIGIVFQQPVTFRGSIEKNVVFAARRLGLVPRWDGAGTVEECLRAACLWDEVNDRLRAEASTLSVGQRQRLALARTLAGDPDVILMDEPTSALDSKATHQLEETLLSLGSEKTIILVTHDEAQAERLADRIVTLSHRASSKRQPR